MRLTEIALSAVLCLFPRVSFCADVTGMITDSAGKPAPGVQVTVQSSAGKPLKTALSGDKGLYGITNLAPGEYRFALEPAIGTFKKGRPLAAHLPENGLTLNWVVSSSADPIALAQPGAAQQVAGLDPFGMSLAEFTSLVGLGTATVAAGVVGGYGAAGGFSTGGPVSPSR